MADKPNGIEYAQAEYVEKAITVTVKVRADGSEPPKLSFSREGMLTPEEMIRMCLAGAEWALDARVAMTQKKQAKGRVILPGGVLQ